MPRPLPPLESLRVFDACARNLNLTQAGEELGLTQPAVSQRIRDLEAELGVQLLLRTRPKLTLTEPGRRLAEEMARILLLLRAAVDAVTDAPLRITAAPTFASRWLAPRLSQAANAPGALPKVEVHISVEEDEIGPGGYDVAFRSGTGHWPGLKSIPILPFEWTPMIAPALRDGLGPDPRPDDLLRQALLPCESWLRWFEAAGIAPPNQAVFGMASYQTQEIIAQAALAGGGVALLTPSLFRRELDSGQLIRPFELSVIGPEAFFAVFDDRHQHPKRDLFLRWLADEAAATAHGSAGSRNIPAG